MTKARLEPYQEIPNIAKRHQKAVDSPYWRFGPWQWLIDYDALERLTKGNTTFIEAVKELAEYKYGFYDVKVYQIHKSFSLIPESRLNPQKIIVVFDCNMYIKVLVGTIGGQWVHSFTLEKQVVEVLFVALGS
jgi:hypothetical protein